MATTITNKGNALLAKLAQGIDLELTSAKTGAGTVDASLLQAQTGVTNMKQEITIKSFSFPEPGTCALVLELTNDGVATGYTLMQIGIYAQDPDEGEILFSIWQVDDAGITIHSETVLPGYSAEWNYNIKFDQAESVTVNVDPSNTISQATMESYVEREVKSALNAHTGNTSNPHNVTPAQIGLGNVNNTADNDKHVAYAVRAGEADQTKSAITIRIDGGRTENTNQWTFDGSTSKAVNITPEKLGVLTADEIAHLYVWDKYDAVPVMTSERVGGMADRDALDGGSLNGAFVYADETLEFSKEISINENGVISLISPRTVSAISNVHLEADLMGSYFYSPMQRAYCYIPGRDTGVSINEQTIGETTVYYATQMDLIYPDMKGSKIGFVAATERDTYPTDGEHTDGLWYVYRKQLGE